MITRSVGSSCGVSSGHQNGVSARLDSVFKRLTAQLRAVTGIRTMWVLDEQEHVSGMPFVPGNGSNTHDEAVVHNDKSAQARLNLMAESCHKVSRLPDTLHACYHCLPIAKWTADQLPHSQQLLCRVAGCPCCTWTARGASGRCSTSCTSRDQRCCPAWTPSCWRCTPARCTTPTTSTHCTSTCTRRTASHGTTTRGRSR
jgi:hypothetical protein